MIKIMQILDDFTRKIEDDRKLKILIKLLNWS